MSDGTTPATARLRHWANKYTDVTGTRHIASSWYGLTHDPISNPINSTEYGTSASSPNDVWTNTNGSGVGTNASCNSWTSASKTDSGYTGVDDATTGGRWTYLTTKPCDEYHRLYCFEQ